MKTSTNLIRLSLVAGWVVVLCFAVMLRPASAQFNTPTVDGTIGSSEYGTHTDGQNQQANGGQVWYMTWDATNLYVGITGANTGQAAIIYLDKNPLAPINGGGNSDGTLVGQSYDSTNFAELQFRADLVLYVKSNYREYRTADGSNGWSSATTGFGSFNETSGTNREFSIPWSVIGGQPSSFAWFGYLTSGTGSIYGRVPTEDSGTGTSIRNVRYYIVNSTADGSSTKPFSRNSYVFNSASDISNFGAISVYDFTMNTSSRTLTRQSGAWTISGSLRVDNGTVSFGSTSDDATVSGNVVIGSGGTLALSSTSGSDLFVGGDWSGDGTFTPNSRAVEFNGSVGQAINRATTWDYLIINNSNNDYGVDLNANQTVNQQLTLTDGLVYVRNYTLTIGSSGSVSGGSTNSFVVTYISEERAAMASVLSWDVPASKAAPEHGEDQVGNVCKVWGSGEFTYPIGDDEGTREYSPIAFTPTNPSGLTVCFRLRDIAHPNLPNNLTDYLTRYWTGEATAGSFSSYGISATFINSSSDVVGLTSNMLPKKWGGSFPWTEGGSMGAPTFTWSGLTSLGDFTAFKSGVLAVTLAEFFAQQVSDHVLVTWETASELGNLGFNLYRGVSPAGPDRRLNDLLIPSQSVGNPGGFVYTWEDYADLVPGTTYYYWVEDVAINGAATRHGPVSVDYVAPTAVTVSGVQASPAAPAALPLVGTLLALLTPLAAAGLRRRA